MSKIISVFLKNIATLFFFGRIKFCPGTIGSFLGLVFSSFFVYQDPKVCILFFFGMFFLSVFSIKIYISESKNKDPSEVIIDEFFAQILSVYLIFVVVGSVSFKLMLSSFVFFRILDIIKPFPISYFDKRIKNAFGVILDDILAALGSSFFTIILYWFGLFV